MKQELVAGCLTEAEAKSIAHRAIVVPAKQFKEAMAHRSIVLPNLLSNLPAYVNAYDTLRPVLESYGTNQKFQKIIFSMSQRLHRLLI